jgi:hypothetical protein
MLAAASTALRAWRWKRNSPHGAAAGEPATVARYVSAALIAKMQAEPAAQAPGGDPFTQSIGSYDWGPGAKLSVVQARTAGLAVAEIVTLQPSDPNAAGATLRVSLVNEERTWKISRVEALWPSPLPSHPWRDTSL